MGRVWLEAATLAHGECALLLVKTQYHLEKKSTQLKAVVERPGGPEPRGMPRFAWVRVRYA